MSNFEFYTGKQGANLPTLSPNPKLHDPALYLPSQGLKNAVNVALNLGLPLLVTGEPGTGKTELATHIAYCFGLGEVLTFHAQTNSQARDLFYRYDALSHYQYAQTQKEPLSAEIVEEKFIRYQALGEAIKANAPKVVLIDEIDKAPRDLPNDILAAIEKLAFEVPEIPSKKLTTYKTEKRPIIILSSNSEKNLPDAFLRRVVYYHIDFPKAEELTEIVAGKITKYKKEELQKLIEHFEKIRELSLKKKPATAELLNWVLFLSKTPFNHLNLMQEKEILKMSYAILAKNQKDIDLIIKKFHAD